jgi:hypothetical protein
MFQFGGPIRGHVCHAHRINHGPHRAALVLIGDKLAVCIAILYPGGFNVFELDFLGRLEKRNQLLIGLIELSVSGFVLIAPTNVHITLSLRVSAWFGFLWILAERAASGGKKQEEKRHNESHCKSFPKSHVLSLLEQAEEFSPR